MTDILTTDRMSGFCTFGGFCRVFAFRRWASSKCLFGTSEAFEAGAVEMSSTSLSVVRHRKMLSFSRHSS